MFLIRSVRLAPRFVTCRREAIRHARISWSSGTTRLEERVLLSGPPPSVLAASTPIAIDSNTSGNLSQHGADYYEI
jgi:hypothetical protein